MQHNCMGVGKLDNIFKEIGILLIKVRSVRVRSSGWDPVRGVALNVAAGSVQ